MKEVQAAYCFGVMIFTVSFLAGAFFMWVSVAPCN